MTDTLFQLAGWVAVMAIWAFLPIAAWHTWCDYQERRRSAPRVVQIPRLAVGELA